MRPGSTWRPPCAPRGSPSSRSRTTLPATAFDILAFNLSAELVYTNVLNLVDLAGMPVRAVESASRPSGRGRRRSLRVQPRAARRLRRLFRARRRGGGRRRDHRGARGRRTGTVRGSRCSAGSPSCRASTSPPATSRATTPAASGSGPERLVEVVPRVPETPERVEKRTVADLAAWPYPKQQLVPLIEVVHDRLERRDLPRLHPGMPVLPGGDDHPPGARAPGGPGPRDGRRTDSPAPATTRWPSPRSRAPTSRASSRPSPRSSTIPACSGQVSVSLPESPGRRVHRRDRGADPDGSAGPVSPSPPRAGPGGCARSSTSSSARRTSTRRSTALSARGGAGSSSTS